MSFGPLHKNALINRSAPITKVTKRGSYALGMRKRSRMVPAVATVGVLFCCLNLNLFKRGIIIRDKPFQNFIYPYSLITCMIFVVLGGLTYTSKNQTTVYGVASRPGSDRWCDGPVIFGRVSHPDVLQWIKQII